MFGTLNFDVDTLASKNISETRRLGSPVAGARCNSTSNTFGFFLNVFRMYVFVVEYVESLLKDTFSSARM